MSELRSICRTCGKNVTNLQGRATKLFNKSNYHFISILENITDMYVCKRIKLKYAVYLIDLNDCLARI